MNKLHRVFFHELGHFVAREINYNYLKGIGSTDISIYPCETDPSEYCGHITPKRPEGVEENENTPVPLPRLAGHLANLLYGCIFQSYYLNLELKVCTDKTGNGYSDINKWLGILTNFKLGYLNREIYPLSVKHFENIITNRLLDPFMSLNPDEYLVENSENHFTVNLDKLHHDLDSIIEGYSTCYLAFVQKHQNIIDKEMICLENLTNNTPLPEN